MESGLPNTEFHKANREYTIPQILDVVARYDYSKDGYRFVAEQNIVNPINIRDNKGIVSVFGKLSDKIKRKTIIDNITVTANDILSPEFQGINKLTNIKNAVANVGTIILIL